MASTSLLSLSTQEALAEARAALAQQRAAAATNDAAGASSSVPASDAPSVAVPLSDGARVEFQQLLDLVAKCPIGGPTEESFARLLPHVKRFVRESDAHAHLSAEMLMSKLRDPQAAVRLNLMHLVDTLFMRSKAFRARMLDHFHALLELTAGVGPNASLVTARPPPVAKELQLMSIACVREWNDTYGEALKLLRIGHDFMQSRVSGMHVPSRREAQQAADLNRSIRRARTQQLLGVRFARLSQEFESSMSEVDATVHEIEGGLEILFPKDSQESFNEFLLRDEPAAAAAASSRHRDSPAASPSPEGEADRERPTKRVKTEEPTEVIASFAAAAALSHADAGFSSAAAPACPSVQAAAHEDVEWEAPQSLDAVSHSRHSLEPATLLPPASSTSACLPLTTDPSAAPFLENQPTDSHWWLDDDDGEEPDAGEEGYDGTAYDEHGALIDVGADESLSPGVVGAAPRGFSMQIEFEANFGAVETDENRAVFQTLRDACHRIQKSFLPLLNEWIDTLTRVEFDDAAPTLSGIAGLPSSVAATPDALRSLRDRHLRRCVEQRTQLSAAIHKCAKLNLRVSTLPADRSAAIRRATERDIVGGGDDEPEQISHDATPTRTISVTRPTHADRAAPLPLTDLSSSSTSRLAAATRAVARIRLVKRRHAKLLAAERTARLQQQRRAYADEDARKNNTDDQ